MALSVKLSRVDHTFSAGEKCAGRIIVKTTSRMAHSGLMLIAHGEVQPQLSARNAGIFGASQLKSTTILRTELPILGADVFEAGEYELPFEFPIEPIPGETLAETYHGVYVNVQYTVSVELKRSGMFVRSLAAQCPLVVHTPSEAKPDPEPNEFEILPASLQNVRAERLSAIPPFRVTGRLEQTNASLTTPFVGHITVDESSERIRSLELQLVRVETVRNEGREARERTEIQNLQVGEGDVARGMPVPLYAVLPRLFTAPTVHRSLFSIEFEVNIIVRFERHYLSTLNIPITLYRG